MEQAMPGAPAGPSKICPHCRAMAQTTDKKCPSCGKKYKKRTGLKIFGAILIAGALLIGGCAALIGGAANEVAKDLDAEQQAHAITKKQFNDLELGMSQAAVVKELGKRPEDRQEFENESFEGEEPDQSSCIYYNRAGGEFGDVFQLCFTNDKLDSKNAY